MLTSLVNWCFWANLLELSALVEVQAGEQHLLPPLHFSLMWVLATAERKMGLLRYI